MIVLNRPQIAALIDLPTAAPAIEHAYRATSKGEITLPPVGHIAFPALNADCHIKYGHIKGAATFAIKVATGFPENAANGQPTGNGLVLVMSARTGAVEAILHDEMMLTDVRTGLGGAIATRALARPDARKVLVLGTGPQALQQIRAHAALMPQQLSFDVWGRSDAAADKIVDHLSPTLTVTRAPDLQRAARAADIIVTATGSTRPLIKDAWVTPGCHITAVGADAPGKQELDAQTVARADIRIADLITQCIDHGEFSHAAHAGMLSDNDITELGTLLEHPERGRQTSDQITICDLTGIAAQDIAIADLVLERWRAENPA